MRDGVGNLAGPEEGGEGPGDSPFGVSYEMNSWPQQAKCCVGLFTVNSSG